MDHKSARRVLELPETGELSEGQLKSAWRAAAKRWHPDRPGGDAARFNQASAAFEALQGPDIPDAPEPTTGDAAAAGVAEPPFVDAEAVHRHVTAFLHGLLDTLQIVAEEQKRAIAAAEQRERLRDAYLRAERQRKRDAVAAEAAAAAAAAPRPRPPRFARKTAPFTRTDPPRRAAPKRSEPLVWDPDDEVEDHLAHLRRFGRG